MSLPEKIEIECPKCGEKRDTVVRRSVNVTLDPKLKEDLFNGRLNVFHYQKCEEEAFVPTDLLYHDMDKKEFVFRRDGGALV